MIKQVKMYTVVCDGCGKDVNQGTEFSCWDDKDYAEDIAAEANWFKKGAKHYCLDCFLFDDNNNPIFRKNE